MPRLIEDTEDDCVHQVLEPLPALTAVVGRFLVSHAPSRGILMNHAYKPTNFIKRENYSVEWITNHVMSGRNIIPTG